jgi:hypothetical protein
MADLRSGEQAEHLGYRDASLQHRNAASSVKRTRPARTSSPSSCIILASSADCSNRIDRGLPCSLEQGFLRNSSVTKMQ